MTVLEKLAKSTDVVIEAIKWPFREASIKRMADDVVDSAEETRLSVESQVIDKQTALSKEGDKDKQRAIFKEIVALRMELEEAQHFSELSTKERAELFKTAKD
ncbi:MAG: hypothetical protein PHX80_03810 [Candidatus Nanoarchaeia archaeon]|nr:hypothetical protein [Candidatus Nanoarchaeia archaeon]